MQPWKKCFATAVMKYMNVLLMELIWQLLTEMDIAIHADFRRRNGKTAYSYTAQAHG